MQTERMCVQGIADGEHYELPVPEDADEGAARREGIRQRLAWVSVQISAGRPIIERSCRCLDGMDR